jgi:hypothetical protein
MRLFGFESTLASLCMRLPQNFICCLVDVLWQPHFFLVRFHACLLHRCGGVFHHHKSSAAPQPWWLAFSILLLFSYQLLLLSKIAIMLICLDTCIFFCYFNLCSKSSIRLETKQKKTKMLGLKNFLDQISYFL